MWHFGAYVRLHKPLLLHVPLMLTRWSALLHNPYPDGDKTKRRIDGIDHRACNMGPNTINHYSKWPQWYKDPYSIPWIGGVMIFYPHFAQNVFFLFKFWYMLDHTPPYTFFGKKHLRIVNMWCIDDALSRWNVGDGPTWPTCSHHSPAKALTLKSLAS